MIGPISAQFLERMGIDDAVGAVSVHGTCGILGVVAVGVLAGGYPPFAEGIPTITFYGQFMGMLVMVALGFVPGYVCALILKACGILRASDGVQQAGMDVEINADAYPEEIRSSI